MATIRRGQVPVTKSIQNKGIRSVLSDVSNRNLIVKNSFHDAKFVKPVGKPLKADKISNGKTEKSVKLALKTHSKSEDPTAQKITGLTKNIKKPSESTICGKNDGSSQSNKLTLAFSSLALSVVDIDAHDDGRYLMVSEYVKDIYTYLKFQEAEYAVKKGYLTGRKVTARMRGILIDWLASVHSRFDLATETLYLCVNLLDRYLQQDCLVSKSELQLVGMAALLIASKFEDIYPPTVEDLVHCSNNTYSNQNLISMEKKIFTKLKFKINAPLGVHFLRRYAKIMGMGHLCYNLAKYLLELCFINYRVVHVPFSCLAAAAASLAIHYTDPERKFVDIWDLTIQEYSGYSFREILTHIESIVTFVVSMESNPLQNLRKKFAAPEYLEVSCLPCLHGEIPAEPLLD